MPPTLVITAVAHVPDVDAVVTPALTTPGNVLVLVGRTRRDFGGGNSVIGGMVTAVLKGGLESARRFLERCDIFALAESLGGVESLIEHPAIMTHASVPKANREKLGISDGLIRLSVGIEDGQDLIDDLAEALG